MSYEDEKETAFELISDAGAPVEFLRITGGAEDIATGTIVGASTDTIRGVAVFLDYKIKDIDGTNIRTGDRRVLYFGDELKVGDKYNNETIVSVMPLNPDDRGAILYKCQVRE